MFKKILAVMLADSNVMLMAGDGYGVKKAPRNEKRQGASKNSDGKKTKRRKFVTIKKNLKSSERKSINVISPLETPIYIPRYYMPVLSAKIDIYIMAIEIR